MKKFFFIAVLLSTCFIACKEHTDDDKKPPVDNPNLTKKKKKDSISYSSANQLIKNLKRCKLDKDSFAFSTFPVEQFQSIMCDTAGSSPITQIRFFVGAMDTTINTKKRWIPVVIMQLKRGGTALIPDYTYEYYKGSPDVCPPPEPCQKTIEDS